MAVSAAAASAQTQPICPWLSTGTAARLLGGEVGVTIKVDNDFAGSCRFARLRGDAAASIEVLVGTADTHACPKEAAKLMAIGNEAVQCRVPGSHLRSDSGVDRIAGRIRDVYFVLTVTGVSGIAEMDPPDPHLADAHPTSPLERLAEQLVGNLY